MNCQKESRDCYVSRLFLMEGGVVCLESYKGIVSDLEKIEDIEIEKTPFAGIPEDTLRKALAVLNEFSQELTKKNDLT